MRQSTARIECSGTEQAYDRGLASLNLQLLHARRIKDQLHSQVGGIPIGSWLSVTQACARPRRWWWVAGVSGAIGIRVYCCVIRCDTRDVNLCVDHTLFVQLEIVHDGLHFSEKERIIWRGRGGRGSVRNSETNEDWDTNSNEYNVKTDQDTMWKQTRTQYENRPDMQKDSITRSSCHSGGLWKQLTTDNRMVFIGCEADAHTDTHKNTCTHRDTDTQTYTHRKTIMPLA